MEKIGDNDVEKVAKQKPDLILVYSTDKNIKNTKNCTYCSNRLQQTQIFRTTRNAWEVNW